jgi:hypothetical protein
MNREAIYSALFDLVTTATAITTTSRTLRHWGDVEANQMPALFLAQGNQVAMPVRGIPTRWELDATLWLYVTKAGGLSAGEVMNPLLDAIADTLDLTAVAPQTLGGLVHYARIEGTIETSEGSLGDLEVAKIPIKMLTA